MVLHRKVVWLDLECIPNGFSLDLGMPGVVWGDNIDAEEGYFVSLVGGG